MSRKVAYLLITKAGPSRDRQLKVIQGTGHEVEPLYEDKALTRRAVEKRELPERDLMLRQLRPGETVLVASPGRLGFGKDDVLSVLRAIDLKGGVLIDASKDQEVRWQPELDIAFDFMNRAVHEHKAQAAATARRAKADAGIKGGRPEKPFKLPEAEVRRRWHNQMDYHRDEVAEAAGKSWRTLHAIFGPRSGRSNARRKKA